MKPERFNYAIKETKNKRLADEEEYRKIKKIQELSDELMFHMKSCADINILEEKQLAWILEAWVKKNCKL